MTEEPTKIAVLAKIAILGSCITRDSFNTKFNPNYKEFYRCSLMQNQMSIISLMSDGFTLTDDQYGDMSAYDRWNVRTDLNKEFLTKVVVDRPHYLILDFFGDVHFGCLRLADGRFITNNRWKLWQTGFYKQLKAEQGLDEFRIQNDTDEYVRVWKESFDRLADYLRVHLPETTVIVHRGRNAELLQLPGRLDLVPLLEHRKRSKLDVREANQLWSTLDDYAASTPGYEVIDLTGKEYPTVDEHPWGAFYVHYTMDYYADFLTALHRIHLRHSYSLTDTDLPIRLLADVQRLAQVTGSVRATQLGTYIEQQEATLLQQRKEIEKLTDKAKQVPVQPLPTKAFKKSPVRKAAPPSARTRAKRRVRRAIRRVPVLERAWQARIRRRPAPSKETGVTKAGAKSAPTAAHPVSFGPVTATVASARWLDRTHYEISGWVFSEGIPATAGSRPTLRVWLQRVDGRRIEAAVTLRVDPEVNTVAEDDWDHSGAAFRASLDLSALSSGQSTGGRWQLRYGLILGALTAEGGFNGRVASGSAGALATSTDAGGCLLPTWTQEGLTVEWVAVLPPAKPSSGPIAWVSEFRLLDGGVPRVQIGGQLRAADPTGLRFQLRGPSGIVEAADLQWRDGAFSATLPLVASFWGRPATLAQGNYRLQCISSVGELVRSALTAGCMQELPTTLRAERLTARLGRGAADTPQVQIKPPLRDDEIGKVSQARLEKQYVKTGLVPDGSVYFESFYGRSASDSPRAIYDELMRRGSPRPRYWAVADYSVQLPEGATPVLIQSKKWWELLARASFFVHNYGSPGPLRKRDDQVVVQTWHGTPLKLLGYDRPSNYNKPAFPRSMAKTSSRWTYMIAGNSYSAEIFKKAYFFHGTMLELGYPRNDALVNTSTAELADIRERIGITPGQQVVLYAPTWRDGEPGVVGYLNAEELGRALGPDYLILVRGHTNTFRNAQRLVGRQVLDVTSYPLINDLFLAADVMITDYSSTMFDFSVTGKPMLFFVPDLEDYRDRRRGTYLDLDATSPGPLLTTVEQVVEALRSLPQVEADYRQRYADWRQKFNPRDDGKATRRVVDVIFGED